MSDLLTRLAQRALGTAAPAVQPRLPSRFADAPGDASPLLREDGDASLLLREEEVETFAPRPAPASRPAPAAAHASPVSSPVLRRELDPATAPTTDAGRTRGTDAVHPAREDAAPRVPAAEPAAHPNVPAAGIEQIVERVVDEHHPAPARSTESRSTASRSTESRSASTAPRPVDGDRPRPASAAPPAHPAQSAERAKEAGGDGFHLIHVVVDAEDDELLMPRATAQPRSAVVRGEDAASPPASPAARARREAGEIVEVAEVAEARAEHREQNADSASTQRGSVVRPEAVRIAERPAQNVAEERPVVRVTIGRIEVRAAPAPAQPQPAARPGWKPPVLSLDDYLQREAGR